MSEVEILWSKLREKFNIQSEWNDLHPMLQLQFIEGVNVILNVLHQAK